MFKYTYNNKRYQTLDYYNKSFYKAKVGRVAINGGFTCPNIDGKKSTGGCIYCSEKGSGDHTYKTEMDLLEQWNKNIANMRTKWPDAKYMAYFQAFSNTYDTIDNLKRRYDVFENLDECTGIIIATRCDCLDEEKVKYLATLKKDVTVELGLQSIKPSTAKYINRGHTLEEFEVAINLLRKYNIKTVTHVINGLKGESHEDMIESAKYVAKLGIHGIKIHLLYVSIDTPIYRDHIKGNMPLMSKDDYIKVVVKQLRYLPENMVVYRVTGDAPSETFIGPIWSRKKAIVMNDIDKYMKEHDVYQGDLYDTL